MELNSVPAPPGSRPSDTYAGGLLIGVFGIGLAVAGVALFATVFEVWPVVDRGDTPATDALGASLFFGIYQGTFPLNTGLMLLVIVAGALGAYIHAATSFVSFVGNRTFKSSWTWWYALRLPIGAGLALLLYFAFRGGLLTGQDASEEVVNPYGVAAISGLAGLFSKQATDKLKEVFDVFFKTASTEGDSARADKLDERRPIVAKLDPGQVKAGERPQVTVTGQAFEDGALVLVNDKPRGAQFVSAQELRFQLEEGDTDRPQRLVVSVRNPPPGALTSEPLTLTVCPA
jgi:hypothetical protein